MKLCAFCGHPHLVHTMVPISPWTTVRSCRLCGPICRELTLLYLRENKPVTHVTHRTE